MENIFNAISEIIGYVLAAGLIWLLKEGISFLQAKSRSKYIDTAVKAAEQLFDKAVDENGTIRLGYVHSMLTDAGYKLTEAVKAEIESRVYELNLAQKQERDAA